MSVRRVTSHVRVVSQQFSEFTHHNHRKLNGLIQLLSSSLQVLSRCGRTPETLIGDSAQQLESESESAAGHDLKLPEHTAACSTRSEHPVKQTLRLTGDILQTASDVMLVRGNTYRCCPTCVDSTGLTFVWLFLEARLVPGDQRAQSWYRCHPAARCFPQPNLHNHQEHLHHRPLPCVAHPDGVGSPQKTRRTRALRPQSAH